MILKIYSLIPAYPFGCHESGNGQPNDLRLGGTNACPLKSVIVWFFMMGWK